MEDSDRQSAALIIGSNDDLLTEILIRLPVTSILRFKSVCKHWRLLLTHRHFTHRYDISNNLPRSTGLLGHSLYVPYDAENRSPHPFDNNYLNFYFNRSYVEQSCNGLLLCSTFYNGVSDYYVFNPTTKQLAFIPSVPKNKNIYSMALAFHQTDCVHYKVVSIIALDPSQMLLQIQVYSSDTGKWKICIESFSVKRPGLGPQVYWNGGVYWAPGDLGNSFLYFNLDVEQLQMLPVPEELVSDEISPMYFGESRGHLHFISTSYHEYFPCQLNVYEMSRDCSGWFVKYRVQFDEVDEVRDFLEEWEYELKVVDVVRGKEEKETFLVLVTPGKVMRYNVHDKTLNPMYIHDKFNDDDSINDFYGITSSCHHYIEALSSF